MIRNYLTIAWRNIIRNRGYAFVNIIGLSIGIACFSLIMLYVRDELSFDSFHTKGDRIYRMALERIYPGRSRHYAIIPAGYAAAVQNDFAEVEKSCRLFSFGPGAFFLKRGENIYEENFVVWSDTTFFDLFDIPFLKGNLQDALRQPNSVVLTESSARKYFGPDEDPVGQVLDIMQNENDLRVTGVCADVPQNSHLRFDMLISSSSLGDFIREPNYINFSALTYFLLKSGRDAKALEAKLPDLVTKYASGPVQRNFGVNYEEYQRQGNGYRYFLQPLPDIYLGSNLESELRPPGSRQRVYFFMAIAFLIIVIACINFMNLATARSAMRAREVGIRKTLGSPRRQIALQFLSEAMLITLVACVLAWALDRLALPMFNHLTDKQFSGAHMLTPGFLTLMLFIAIVTGLLSGAYPAASLSSFKPLDVVRGRFSSTRKGALLRNGLVVFQFGISVFLIISTILVYQQLAFTQNKNLGFDKESLLSIRAAGGLTAQQSETLKEQIRQLAGVDAVSGCNTQPGEPYFGVSFRPQGANETTTGSGLIVDEGYIECMKMGITEGRSFSKDFTDTLSIVINEAAVREMEMTDPIGKTLMSNNDFFNPGQDSIAWYTIIGVVKDFHFQSLHHVISPLFLVHHQRNFVPGVDNLITVRLKPGDLQGPLRQMESLWKKVQPDTPFRYAFLDREWAHLYESEMTTRKVYGFFSMLAIFIACLGLLALAAFTTEQRTKEIGIRKVLGASVSGIVGLLSKDFLKLVLISLVIASPIAWYLMNKWLQGFAYRITIDWWVFALSGAIAILIAFLTVSFQSVRAAVMNPVESLKNE